MKPINSEEQYQELAIKWLNNTITLEEREKFAAWYNSGQNEALDVAENFAGDEEELKNRIYSSIDKKILGSKPIFRISRTWYSVAAAALVIISSGLYFYLDKSQTVLSGVKSSKLASASEKSVTKILGDNQSNEELLTAEDIPAGNDKAILTLGDGTKIILDDAQNGILANQGGNSILKTAKGELIYSFSNQHPHPQPAKNTETLTFNTIETPKGGKFQVKLPDGSKVWLNAASTLRFPTAFTGEKREVELSGEAYFEVAHDQHKLFEVTTRNQTVQVLGTHFNINAYSDEPSVNTTLLEGSVRISDLRTNSSQLLKPGEQAKVSEKIEVVNIKNTSETVAWKDGYFQFNEADIETVMRQIGRWYDVSVRYENEVPNHRFGGEIERNLSLLQVLTILEKTGINFHLEGREVIVMP